ncbi:MAG: 2-oxoacid:acceptor oxidoreductase family protein [Coriobacteriales bacterium]|jgi:pyruvate ferredoxin oxidoreductase gamma subunit|nr:2-oxoacid:acceptor oxidoreductase family protein [Coriobacteriales bacterium]
MGQLTEIRWHARAGQGAVTASKLLAETALMKGSYIQSMPEYGPERTGAPLRAYSRISSEPIEVHNNIVNPDVVVVLDETLLPIVDVLEGIKPEGTLVINSAKNRDEIRELVDAGDDIKVAVVDASRIALDTIRRDIPNTPVVGALAHITHIVSVDDLKENLIKTFGKKFAREIIDANLESVDRAVGEVQVA